MACLHRADSNPLVADMKDLLQDSSGLRQGLSGGGGPVSFQRRPAMTDFSLETTNSPRLPAIRLPAIPIGKLFRVLVKAMEGYGTASSDAYGAAMGFSRQPRREEERY
jgi:hypothetical protein